MRFLTWFRSSELKRRNEARAKEARKAEKAAANAQKLAAEGKAPTAKSAEKQSAVAEEELTPNVRSQPMCRSNPSLHIQCVQTSVLTSPCL